MAGVQRWNLNFELTGAHCFCTLTNRLLSRGDTRDIAELWGILKAEAFS